jgi:hypothetical protein
MLVLDVSIEEPLSGLLTELAPSISSNEVPLKELHNANIRVINYIKNYKLVL